MPNGVVMHIVKSPVYLGSNKELSSCFSVLRQAIFPADATPASPFYSSILKPVSSRPYTVTVRFITCVLGRLPRKEPRRKLRRPKRLQRRLNASKRYCLHFDYTLNLMILAFIDIVKGV